MDIILRGKKNIGEEIADEYEKLIRFGVLKEGDKLPSCRALAVQLGINANTAERAFAELEHRGLVKTLPKKGVFVHVTDTESLKAEARKQVTAMKLGGLTREELEDIIKDIYGEENV